MSCRQETTKYLEANEGFQWAGSISRAVHELTGQKESIVERRLREYENEGLLIKTYEQVNGQGPKCVLYRLKPLSERS